MERAVILCDGYFGQSTGKTANGLVRYSKRYEIVGVIDHTKAGRDAGEVLDGKPNDIPIVADLKQAIAQRRPETLIIGVATFGGYIPKEFRPTIREAIENRLNVVAGLHEYLNDDPEFAKLADAHGVRLVDVRKPRPIRDSKQFSDLSRKLPCLRIPGLRTDGAIGKRTTALLLTDPLNAAPVPAPFVATCQTGPLMGPPHAVPLASLKPGEKGNRHRNQSRDDDEGRGGRHRANRGAGTRDSDRRSALARLWKVRGCDPADDMTIPRSHPRYESLVRRERLVRAWKDGVVAPEGLIAHGRGEAWDYLFAEATSPPALLAARAAAAHLLAASHPVISVNGNVAALAAREVVQLARAIPARIEVNLFLRTESRVKKIVRILECAGARDVLGLRPNARIPGIESKRALSHRDGIFGADVVLVPLEDGDRAEALVRMGKAVISIDLNPLSRTSQRATIPIVDELRRAILNIKKFVEELKENPEEAARVRRAYRRSGNLGAVYSFLEWRLGSLRRGLRRGEKGSGAAKRKRATHRATGRHRQ